jgi:hypothetical protein
MRRVEAAFALVGVVAVATGAAVAWILHPLRDPETWRSR